MPGICSHRRANGTLRIVGKMRRCRAIGVWTFRLLPLRGCRRAQQDAVEVVRICLSECRCCRRRLPPSRRTRARGLCCSTNAAGGRLTKEEESDWVGRGTEIGESGFLTFPLNDKLEEKIYIYISFFNFHFFLFLFFTYFVLLLGQKHKIVLSKTRLILKLSYLLCTSPTRSHCLLRSSPSRSSVRLMNKGNRFRQEDRGEGEKFKQSKGVGFRFLGFRLPSFTVNSWNPSLFHSAAEDWIDSLSLIELTVIGKVLCFASN